MLRTANVIRCDLPTPDMFVVNHPRHGTLIFADWRVPLDQLQTFHGVVCSRTALHPTDWAPNPRGWLSAAGA